MQDKKDSIDFRALLFRYIDNWKIIIASIIVCVGVAFIYSKIQNPVFEINANVLIKGEDDGGGMGSSSALKSFNLGFGSSVDVEDELEVIASYSIMKKAISQLNLNTSYNERKFYIKKTEKYKNSVVDLKYNDVITDTLSTFLRFDVTIDSKKRCNVKVKDKDGTILKVKKQSFPVVLNTIYGDFTLSETTFLAKDESYRYTIVVNNNLSVTPIYISLI